MANCISKEDFIKVYTKVKQSIEINKQEESLRLNIWDFDFSDIQNLLFKGVSSVSDKLTSKPIKSKIEKLMKSLHYRKKFDSVKNKTVEDFKDKIINDEDGRVIELSIALNEIMDSIKGESDKALSNGIKISDISNDGFIPNLPISRVVESIGRKIAYQKGIRFKNKGLAKDKKTTPEEIGKLYYDMGMYFVEQLQNKGYVTINDSGKGSTIKDYIDATNNETRQVTKKKDKVVNNIKSLSLNLDSLGKHKSEIKSEKEGVNLKLNDAVYFNNRSKAKIENTSLGQIVNTLKIINLVSQPLAITFPKKEKYSKEELAKFDRDYTPDPALKQVKDALQNNPVKINNVLHSLFTNLHNDGKASGLAGSDLILQNINFDSELMLSLFNIKKSDEFSVDKTESVKGQNTSKTVPFNDLIEHYNDINSDGDANLHLGLKTGRNSRLYYWNSVLNPHASKHSRYMLSPGKTLIKQNSEDYKRIVSQIADSLRIMPEAILGIKDFTDTNKDKLNKFKSDSKSVDEAIDLLDLYKKAKKSQQQINQITKMSKLFPGIDFVTLLTSIQAITDIRSPDSENNIETEYAVSSDATASGGSITFLHALGTNSEIPNLLRRLRILGNNKDEIDNALNDVYGIMQESINNFIKEKENPLDVGYSRTKEERDTNARVVMKGLNNTLYSNLREFVKGPTTTFIYGQGKESSIEVLSTKIADDIIDNLNNTKVVQLMKNLLKKDSNIYESLNETDPTKIDGLYPALVNSVVESGVPEKLYELVDTSIRDVYLKEYTNRSKKIFSLLEDTQGNYFRILPAHAVLQNNVSRTKTNLAKYGVPISKVFDVASEVDNETIFTRKQRLLQTVLGVSTIHSIDTAQMYGALHDIGIHKGNKPGVLVIHDDVRSTPEIVSKVEKSYVKLTKDIIEKYDIHDQVLQSIAVYTPDVVNNADYIALRNEVDESIRLKKELLKEFNYDTESIIGDSKWKQVPNVDTVVVEKKEDTISLPKTKSKFSSFKELGSAIKKDTSISNVLNNLSSESTIIKRYLESTNKANIVLENSDSFNPYTDTIQISTISDKKENKYSIKTLIEHEIVHSFTVGYIQKMLDKGTDNRLKFIDKSVDQIKNLVNKGNLDSDVHERMVYVLSKSSKARSLNEFIAIMSTEPNIANKVYSSLAENKTKLQKAIEYIKQQANNFISVITKQDLDNKYIDIAKLQGSINGVIQDGYSLRENDFNNFKKYQQSYEGILGIGNSPVSKRNSLNYLNYAVSSILTTQIETKTVKTAKSLDNLLAIKFPLYLEARNKLEKVYSDSESLQQLFHAVTNKNIDRSAKNKILSHFAKLRAEKNDITADQLAKFNQVTKSMPKDQKEYLYDLIHKTPLHDYFVLSSHITEEEQFDERIKQLENSIPSGYVKSVNQIVHLRTVYEKSSPDSKDTYEYGMPYNLDTVLSEGNLFIDQVKELLALKSIKALGINNFKKFIENTELVTLVKDNSIANKISTFNNNEHSKLNDSLIAEYYEEPFQLRVIGMEDLKKYENEGKRGWKVLRVPDKNTVGVVYRFVIDSTYMQGAFTDIKLSSTDIDIPSKYKNLEGAIRSAKGLKLVLKDYEKEKLGLVKDPAQSLVRSTVHSLAVQDSQVIRNMLLKEDVTFTAMTDQSKEELLDIIGTKNVDNPWFLKIKDNDYINLDDKIKAIYKPVERKLSDVKDFDKSISLVRKDISHWLIGDSRESLSENKSLRWVLRTVKNLIAGSKMGMVIINPVKIAKDNVSNISYLSVMGVNPIYIQEQYRKIASEFKEYSDIKESLIHLRIKQISNPENKIIQAQFKAKQKQLVGLKIHNVYKNGFVNSLGTDLIHQNADTLSGMQSDLQKVLSFLLKDKKGNINFLGKYIRDLSRIGGNAEDVLYYLSKLMNKADSLKGIGGELTSAANRIKELKSDEDVINYTSQFMITPNSETVKVGSYVTDLTDILAKETYYRYLTEKQGMNKKDAVVEVIESFPDYKENMPTFIKQLSDMGILMFPSFWLRIQKVIYRMIRDKPINLSIELQLESMLDKDVNTIIDSNIISKHNDFTGILHSPHEYIGVGSIFPINAI